jgi:hypothetical protein
MTMSMQVAAAPAAMLGPPLSSAMAMPPYVVANSLPGSSVNLKQQMKPASSVAEVEVVGRQPVSTNQFDSSTIRRSIGVRKVSESQEIGKPRVVSRKKLEEAPNWLDIQEEVAAHAAAASSRSVQEFIAPTASSHVAFPDAADRLPQYGRRVAWWRPQFQIQQPNNGVLITHEFGTPSHYAASLEVPFNDDDAICNPNWKHLGSFTTRRYSANDLESMDSYLHHHADYADARDLRAMHKDGNIQRSRPDYYSLKKDRDIIFTKIEARARRSIMNSEEVKEFFEDTGAVMYETI